MTATVNAIGPAITDISSNVWYSFMSFATDYQLGVNASPIVPAQIPGKSGPRAAILWQFVPAGPDFSQGVYALRSAAFDGDLCLYGNCTGPELCLADCGQDSGQFEVHDNVRYEEGRILILSQSSGQSALAADSDSLNGDEIKISNLYNSGRPMGNFYWLMQDLDDVDTAKYPMTFTPTYSSPSSSSQGTATMSSTNNGDAHAQTTVAGASIPVGDGMVSETSSVPRKSESPARSRNLFAKAAVAGIACLLMFGAIV